MDPDKIREALREGTWLSMRQRRRVQKNLGRKKVPLVVEFRGGEYLEMVDLASAQDKPVEQWLQDFTRQELEEVLGHPLGFRYEAFDDELGAPPALGPRTLAGLKRGRMPNRRTGIHPDEPEADVT
jgi:hypothetical protein